MINVDETASGSFFLQRPGFLNLDLCIVFCLSSHLKFVFYFGKTKNKLMRESARSQYLAFKLNFAKSWFNTLGLI